MTAPNTRDFDEPADSVVLFTTLLNRFGALGGVELDLPRREEPARAADFVPTDRFAEGSLLHFVTLTDQPGDTWGSGDG